MLRDALGGARARLLRPAAGRRRRAGAARHALGRPAQQPRQPRVAAGREHHHRARPCCSGARWRTARSPVPRHARPPVPRPLARARRARRRRHRATSTARSTTTSSTRERCSATSRGRRRAGPCDVRAAGAAPYFRGYLTRAGLGRRPCWRCAAGSAPAKRRALRRFVDGRALARCFRLAAARPLRAPSPGDARRRDRAGQRDRLAAWSSPRSAAAGASWRSLPNAVSKPSACRQPAVPTPLAGPRT